MEPKEDVPVGEPYSEAKGSKPFEVAQPNV